MSPEPAEETEKPAACSRCGGRLSHAMSGLCPQCVARTGIEGWLSPSQPPVFGLVPDAEDLAAQLDGIELEQLIGSGGMGVVYQGRQVALDRPVAVKFLNIDKSAHPELAERFRVEKGTESHAEALVMP